MNRLVKDGRKWIVKGDRESWIRKKKLPAKWKAEIAMRVFINGGRVSDYWREARKCSERRPDRVPARVLEEMKGLCDAICGLNLTGDEIEEFAKGAAYGVVTVTENNAYFPPHIHNTSGKKSGGRVHIDIGCCGYHLMLDKNTAPSFIDFIKRKRRMGTLKV